MFDIGHQAVDEADVLDVLPGDDFDVQVVAQAVGVLLQEEAAAAEIWSPGKTSSIPMIWSLA